jgi:histidyl-tRNA synthetase
MAQPFFTNDTNIKFNNMARNNLQRARGVKDLLPQEKIARNQLIEKLREVFELYGYNPIETPIIERYDLFASKFGIGEESDAMKETFKLKDQGKRDLVLRTEFTMPLARYIGMNDVKLPFKRYQIGKVFRDGPIKLGRYREFWQCDVDCIGVNNLTIDAELIELTQNVFEQFGLEIEIQINNRVLLNDILEKAAVKEEERDSFIITIDKLDKIGASGVKKELTDKGFSTKQIKEVLEIISIKGNNEELIIKIGKKIGESDGLKNVKRVLSLVKNVDNVRFLPTLARGLAYYTGTVYEVFLKDGKEFSSSLAGGGRYDEMLSGLIGDKKDYPAIGISFGLNAIYDAMEQKKMLGNKKTVVDAYVFAVSKEEQDYCVEVVRELRAQGIRVNSDFLGKNMKKNLEIVNNLEIPFAIIVGEEERKEGKLTIKNMKTGEQQKGTSKEVRKIIKN